MNKQYFRWEKIREATRRHTQQIEDSLEQREDILNAFIAKYGYDPDQIMQVEQRMNDGSTRWMIQKIPDDFTTVNLYRKKSRLTLLLGRLKSALQHLF